MKSTFFGRKRIVIGGLPRSGSTLLRFMLDRSESILSGPETNFFRTPLWQTQTQASTIAKAIATKLEIPVDAALSAISNSNSSVFSFDQIAQIYAKALDSPKEAWAEKTPANCHAYHRLAAEDPDLYFISTIRHGLDVVTSKIPDHPKNSGYWCPIQRYIDDMRAIDSFHHERHFIWKYEEFVANPLDEGARLFDFLREPFSDAVVNDFHKPSSTRDLSKVNQPKLQEGLSHQWVGRWQESDHKAKVKEFLDNNQAVYWLEKFAYERPCKH